MLEDGIRLPRARTPKTRSDGRNVVTPTLSKSAAFGWLLAVFASIAMLGGVAAAAHGDISDVEVADRLGFAEDDVTGGVGTSDANAIVQYIGDENETFGAAGTGTFNSFVRLQKAGSEAGYNTDGTREFDTKSGMWTHSLLLSGLPTITIDGLTYWEVWADINETDSTKKVSLDEFELWLTDDPNLTGYDFGTAATNVYDWSGHIKVNDVNQGSGRGDLRMFVPYDSADESIPENCQYGSTTCTTYVVLYSAWGGFGDGTTYNTDGGFEEWKVREYPELTITKTIDGRFDQDKTWEITKEEDTDYNVWIGDDVDHPYVIEVVPTIGAAYNHKISGEITVTGDDEEDLTVTVTDLFDGSPADVDCGDSTGVVEVAANATVVCSYTLDLDSSVAATNVATGTFTFKGVELSYYGTAAIAEADYTSTIVGADEIDVLDDLGTVSTEDDMSFGPVSVSTEFGYTTTFDCPTDLDLYVDGSLSYEIVNEAVIDQTGQSDTATVTITCWALDVSKTAETSFDLDYDWTIEKQVSVDGGATWVDETTVEVINGTDIDLLWRIAADKSDGVELNHAVAGDVTVTNPAPMEAVGVVVTDALSDGQTPAVDCGGGSNTVTIAANSSVDCNYSADLADNGDLTNTGTAVLGAITFSGEANVDFDGVDPTTITDDTAALTDERLVIDTVLDADWTSEVDELPETVSCGEHKNIVALDPSDSDAAQADATVTVDCLDPVVTKTVETALTRTYNWELVKTALYADGTAIPDGEGLTLAEGQSYTLNWEIVADLDDIPVTDSEWAVSGIISVTNPAPDPLSVTVTDTLTLGGVVVPVIIDCGDGDGDLTVTVPAADGEDGTAACSYRGSPTSGEGGGNVASITYVAGGDEYHVDSDEVAVDFASADTVITPIDETVDVFDLATVPSTLLGSVSAADVPVTFTWNTELGPDNLVCGLNEIVNSARSLNDDGVELALSSDVVMVNVTCGDSCTLTAGYWMTHNPEFWAAHNGHGPPEDETWYLLGDVDGDGEVEGAGELFPYGNLGLTYYEIMRTPPKGDPWMQLAFQYTAAKLNVLNEADPTALGTAIDQAEWLLDTYKPGQKGKKAKNLRELAGPVHSLLAAYNEGDIGPGHCDEDSSSP